MDINGAKALKERLGLNRADEAPSARAPVDVDVAEDAPPVYQWLGVAQAPETPPDVDGGAATGSASLFRRLGLSFR